MVECRIATAKRKPARKGGGTWRYTAWAEIHHVALLRGGGGARGKPGRHHAVCRDSCSIAFWYLSGENDASYFRWKDITRMDRLARIF